MNVKRFKNCSPATVGEAQGIILMKRAEVQGKALTSRQAQPEGARR
jgi:hypothetical protein